jgi:hypothetical protein
MMPPLSYAGTWRVLLVVASLLDVGWVSAA